MTIRGRVFITGGAGFLGSHLCDRMIAEGFAVVCFDSLLTGSLRNVAHLLDHPHFAFVRGDVTEPVSVDGPLDYVLHFGSPASPKDYARFPLETLKAGAAGTITALELASAKDAIFVMASSSEVYGDPHVNPQPETYWGHVNSVGERSMYDEAKRFAEAVTAAYHRTSGLQTRIVRIFNTYGPRMRVDDGRALPTFVAQALAGRPLTVYGDGSQTRSFCYVTDLVDGVMRLMALPSDQAAADDELWFPVNLGNPEEKTILDLAKMIIAATGGRSEIVFEPLPQDDPKVRCPDIRRATRLLGWVPTVSLREGIPLVVADLAARTGERMS